MNTLKFSLRFSFNLGLLLLLAAGLSSLKPLDSETRSFQILSQSQLYLEGSSNVAPFTCRCTQSFPPLQYTAIAQNNNKAAIAFRNTALQLQTNKLDCGNRGMNRDMQETLKAAQYPAITMRLLEASPENGKAADSQGWKTLKAKAYLTIAGVERLASFEVSARESGKGEYRFVSAFPVKMTDYSITPPTALMGLIKVDDQIEIHMDLAVRVEGSSF